MGRVVSVTKRILEAKLNAGKSENTNIYKKDNKKFIEGEKVVSLTKYQSKYAKYIDELTKEVNEFYKYLNSTEMIENYEVYKELTITRDEHEIIDFPEDMLVYVSESCVRKNTIDCNVRIVL